MFALAASCFRAMDNEKQVTRTHCRDHKDVYYCASPTYLPSEWAKRFGFYHYSGAMSTLPSMSMKVPFAQWLESNHKFVFGEAVARSSKRILLDKPPLMPEHPVDILKERYIRFVNDPVVKWGAEDDAELLGVWNNTFQHDDINAIKNDAHRALINIFERNYPTVADKGTKTSLMNRSRAFAEEFAQSVGVYNATEKANSDYDDQTIALTKEAEDAARRKRVFSMRQNKVAEICRHWYMFMDAPSPVSDIVNDWLYFPGYCNDMLPDNMKVTIPLNQYQIEALYSYALTNKLADWKQAFTGGVIDPKLWDPADDQKLFRLSDILERCKPIGTPKKEDEPLDLIDHTEEDYQVVLSRIKEQIEDHYQGILSNPFDWTVTPADHYDATALTYDLTRVKNLISDAHNHFAVPRMDDMTESDVNTYLEPWRENLIKKIQNDQAKKNNLGRRGANQALKKSVFIREFVRWYKAHMKLIV
jgi:hypothetical protein